MSRTDAHVARRHLETTADLVVVHDVMAEAMTELWGIYSRASWNCEPGSAEDEWWRNQARAVKNYQKSINTRDRTEMIRALDIVQGEIDRARTVTAA